MGSEVSTQGDVYSFGILVLEMFTGYRPTDEMFKEGQNLHEHAKKAFPEKVAEVVDPFLLSEQSVTEMSFDRRSSEFEYVQECLVCVTGVGVACSAEQSRDRLGIAEAFAQLSSAKEKLLKSERRQTFRSSTTLA